MDASAAEPTPFDSQPAQQASAGNPLALGGADDAPGQAPGGGESAEAADLPPASELLPKLHLALKMAGHGNWPRLAVPLLLLTNIGFWAAMVRSSTIWALAGGMLSLVAGAGISVIREAEAGTAAGSLGG